MRWLVMIMLVGSLSACSMAPELERPAPPVPARFAEVNGVQGGTLPARELGWRTMFADPQLQRLIELALAHNRDLRLAALNVEAARSMFNVQQSTRLPSVSLDASHTRERSLAQDNSGGARREVSNQVAVNAGISAFELDLFGRVRSLSDAALARYLASEQGRDAAQIALIGAVADAYFARQLADEQRQLAERTLTDWQQSLKLAHLLQAAKQNSGLDVAQAEGQVASAEADLQACQRAFVQAGNTLQLLVGNALPADLPAARVLERQTLVAPLPTGLRSDMLLLRPDIRQAEQILSAANADIGAARAAFFPQVSLTGSFGYASTSLGSLFDPSRQVWRFTPQISQPLFQAGRLRSELRLAEVRKSEAVVQYERAIQIAFREVADALAGVATLDGQIQAQTRVVASAQRRVSLSALRYEAGVDGRLELLDAQRQLYGARQTLLELRRDAVVNSVALYKALGGGLRERTVITAANSSTADPAYREP
ncbi:RND transporter [Pseudomonas sp. PA15(2017)]|uniref:efflux transporter outer membrane subunit n=1 Tax=Pseudomonas sp. PA15(2017) TaxID=1932111 RepID=UPI0009670C45|nr:efflux transporter outer membrane subunit [Pseudomonas sp. PA15(2017)]OLU33746.1 RND transporter [Pseudomonas sp. PA15(2017)]